MKHVVAAVLLVIALAGCGGGSKTDSSSAVSPSPSTASSAGAAASGCTASGLDAMTALSDFQLEMDKAQKAGKLSVDQLMAARDKLFNQTQAAADKDDWAAYCKAIDDMRTELGL